jgi:dephospho-CoA kinase
VLLKELAIREKATVTRMSDRVHRWVLSGGIGSGKSTVRRLLEEHGFRGIDADSVGHEVLAQDGAAFNEVSQRWPQVVVDGAIDRAALGRIVFADSEELRALETITHPHIFGTILARLKDWSGSVVVEVPITNHGLGIEWRQVIVDVDDEVRLKRLVGRGMTESDARTRMRAQPSRSEWLATADVVIPNHGDSDTLLGDMESLGGVLGL